MRLINTSSLELKEFSRSTPEYAILSHTWESTGEISLQDLQRANTNLSSPVRNLSGYDKVVQTCRLANRAGLQWVWVDTCCIDKTSSAELIESINSMFRWYRDAKLCFVYLSDLETSSSPRNARLSHCRWFSRGWCLQELIAPKKIIFLSKDWTYFGSKRSLTAELSTITRINVEILEDSSLLVSVPVGRRMSWAAKRITTRVEDMAYSLLGIFDISMSMQYGEGEKAFIRLQEEIIRKYSDLSLFAWAPKGCDIPRYLGLLAKSPADFESCADLEPVHQLHQLTPLAFSVTNCGIFFSSIRITSPLGLAEMDAEWDLGFRNGPPTPRNPWKSQVSIYVRKVGPGVYVRVNSVDSRFLDYRTNGRGGDITEHNAYISSSVPRHLYSLLDDSGRFRIKFETTNGWVTFDEVEPRSHWCPLNLTFLTAGKHNFAGYVKFQVVTTSLQLRSVYAVFGLGHIYPKIDPFVFLVDSDTWDSAQNGITIPGRERTFKPILAALFQPVTEDSLEIEQKQVSVAIRANHGPHDQYFIVHLET